MTKNADLGPNLAVFGPKSQIFMGVSKSFGTKITENHQDNLSALFFGQALDPMGQKCRYLAKNTSFGPNLAVFGPKILNCTGFSKSFGTHIMEKTPRQLVRIVFWSGLRSNGPYCPYLAENASFGPNLAVFGPKKQLFEGKE